MVKYNVDFSGRARYFVRMILLSRPAWGALHLLLVVAFGALGAHALKQHLAPADLDIFEKAVRYHAYHGIAILVLGFQSVNTVGRWPHRLFQMGILFFSGSLYLYAIRDLLGIDLTALVYLTPLGGIAFLAGWAVLVRYLSKSL